MLARWLNTLYKGIFSYIAATRAVPEVASAEKLLESGHQLEDLGQPLEALAHYRRASELAPQWAKPQLNIGNALVAITDFVGATVAYQKALALQPGYAAAHFNLGNVFLQRAEIGHAAAQYRLALDADPEFTPAEFALYSLVHELDASQDSEFHYRESLALQPPTPQVLWARAMAQVRPVYETCVERDSALTAFENAVNELEPTARVGDLEAWKNTVGTTRPFHLAYHPVNLREPMTRYGALCSQIMGSSGVECIHRYRDSGKWRIGIISAHLHNHSVWSAITRGWLEHLDQETFDIHVFHVGHIFDSITEYARGLSKVWIEGPRSRKQWREKVLEFHLDAILYPEIGMDTVTIQLAAERLAPVQMVSWGHPVTSGFPTIDYFLSAQSFEPLHAQSCYSEKLLTLPSLGISLSPFDGNWESPDLVALGLVNRGPLLISGGMPFKYGPECDPVWCGIAKRLLARGGTLVFFKTHFTLMSIQFERRLRNYFHQQGVPFDQTVCFVPELPRPVFFGLLRGASLFLDTLEFSGFNTALQALECGLPVVAYEGHFMRGRLASGLLRELGLDRWVATSHQEFIELSIHLAFDASMHLEYRQQLALQLPTIYNDTRCIRALEAHVVQSCASIPSDNPASI